MTKDEFLDIMGEIDSELIEGTLDNSRVKVIKLEGERPPVLRYIMSIAACIAILVTIIAAGFLKGIPTLFGNSSGDVFASDIIRGWDPEKLVYSDKPEIGGNMRVSVAKLDGITAELILHNIKKVSGTKLPAERSDNDYTNYVGAEDIVLYIHDNKGRRFIEASVTPHSYNGMELIYAHCLFDDCTRLYKVEDDYVLMQYTDGYNEHFNCRHCIFTARFYKVDLNRYTQRDENGIYSGGLTSVEIKSDRNINDWKYSYTVSSAFEYVGGGKFHDPLNHFDMYWNG